MDCVSQKKKYLNVNINKNNCLNGDMNICEYIMSQIKIEARFLSKRFVEYKDIHFKVRNYRRSNLWLMIKRVVAPQPTKI
jgi:hypothetical protein